MQLIVQLDERARQLFSADAKDRAGQRIVAEKHRAQQILTTKPVDMVEKVDRCDAIPACLPSPPLCLSVCSLLLTSLGYLNRRNGPFHDLEEGLSLFDDF